MYISDFSILKSQIFYSKESSTIEVLAQNIVFGRVIKSTVKPAPFRRPHVDPEYLDTTQNGFAQRWSYSCRFITNQ